MNVYCLCSKCLAWFTKWKDNRGTLSHCFWSYRRFTSELVFCSVSSGTVEVVAVLSETSMASILALETNVWWRNDITLKSALKKYLTYFRTDMKCLRAVLFPVSHVASGAFTAFIFLDIIAIFSIAHFICLIMVHNRTFILMVPTVTVGGIVPVAIAVLLWIIQARPDKFAIIWPTESQSEMQGWRKWNELLVSVREKHPTLFLYCTVTWKLVSPHL